MQLNFLDSTSIPALQEVVQFAEARHGVLAGNIANLDTPGYKVRDLSVDTFQQRLREALEARDQEQAGISPGLLSTDPDEAMRRVKDSMETILYHDDSNVGMEQQVLEISKNQFMHNLAVTIMTNQFRLLESAVSESV